MHVRIFYEKLNLGAPMSGGGWGTQSSSAVIVFSGPYGLVPGSDNKVEASFHIILRRPSSLQAHDRLQKLRYSIYTATA